MTERIKSFKPGDVFNYQFGNKVEQFIVIYVCIDDEKQYNLASLEDGGLLYTNFYPYSELLKSMQADLSFKPLYKNMDSNSQKSVFDAIIAASKNIANPFQSVEEKLKIIDKRYCIEDYYGDVVSGWFWIAYNHESFIRVFQGDSDWGWCVDFDGGATFPGVYGLKLLEDVIPVIKEFMKENKR